MHLNVISKLVLSFNAMYLALALFYLSVCRNRHRHRRRAVLPCALNVSALAIAASAVTLLFVLRTFISFFFVLFFIESRTLPPLVLVVVLVLKPV